MNKSVCNFVSTLAIFASLNACGGGSSNNPVGLGGGVGSGYIDDQPPPKISLFSVVGANGSTGPALLEKEQDSKFDMQWKIDSDMPAFFYIYVTKNASDADGDDDTENRKQIHQGGCGATSACGSIQSVSCKLNDRNQFRCGESSAVDLSRYVESSYIVIKSCVIFSCITSSQKIKFK